MRDLAKNPAALALNTATLGHMVDGAGIGWSPEQVIDACAQRSFGGITFWRREFAGANPLSAAAKVGERVRAAGMQVTGLCRTPFITGPFAPKPRAAMRDDFIASIELAGALGAECLVIVVGGVEEGSRGLGDSLKCVAETVAEMAPKAAEFGTRLALEPLHPVYAGNRSCLVTVRDAVDLCEQIGHPAVGVAIDVYHVWWDLTLAAELERAGLQRLAGFHICDWLAHTSDVLFDRGMMGDGVADLKRIRRDVEAIGFDGCCEVEIFSKDHWWQQHPEHVLDQCLERFQTVC